MAKLNPAPTRKYPIFVSKLRTELRSSLAKAGIEAKTSHERVQGTKLYRIVVESPKFEKMLHSERQDLVWRIAQKALNPSDLLLVSMILTMTPREKKGG